MLKNEFATTYTFSVTLPLLRKTFITSSLKGVVRIDFGRGPSRVCSRPVVEKFPLSRCAAREIEQYLEGRRNRFTVKPHLVGTQFQKRVWREAMRTPYGRTISYGQLAARLGMPGAARAVGNALAANPVPIIVPCHRIIRADGTLGGFGAGTKLKKRLLALEAASLC